MDPVEDSLPGSAALPPPTPAVAPASGPKIFVLSPLRGNRYEVDRYFYSPAADVTGGTARLSSPLLLIMADLSPSSTFPT
jgi:hypothetical protein